MSHTLLLADDSLTIQRVIELTFADEDVNVVTVSDGDEAIAVMDRTPPDIVLADVGMPGRNGYEVAEHIRDTPRLAHIPIVLLTGAFEPIDQAKATAAGCDGVLAKPFEPQLVIGRVRELLSKPKQTAPIDDALPPPVVSGRSRAAAAPEVPRVPTSHPSASTPQPSDVGHYFDRLDQALAALSAGPADASAPTMSIPPGATALDWFATQQPTEDTQPWIEPTPSVRIQPPAPGPLEGKISSAETLQMPISSKAPKRWDASPSTSALPPDLPYSYAAVPPPPAFDDDQTRPITLPLPQLQPQPTLPPLADAFAALLAAEQATASPIAAPVWPSPPRPLSPPAAAITDEVIEQVVQHVLDRLSDRVLREAVDGQVAAIAERLIREEIDRIKASLKA